METFSYTKYTSYLIVLLSEATDMSRVMRKPKLCIYKNKGADQLRSYCKADESLCFRLTDSTIPLLSKSEISSL